MKKVLWFSRHELSPAQVSDLGALFGPIEVTQIDRTIQSVREIEAEVEAADILAIVAPLPLQGEFLRAAGDRPVLIPRNHRVANGEGGFDFFHAGWSRLEKIEVVVKELTNHPAPEGAFRK